MLKTIQRLQQENEQLREIIANETPELPEIHETQGQLRSAFFSIDDDVYVFDKAHRLLTSNIKPEKTGLLITRHEQCYGRLFTDIFPAPFASKLEIALAHRSKTEEIQQFEYCLQDYQVSFYFKISINDRQDAAGRYAGFTMVVRDMTEEKIAAKKIIDSEKRYRSVVENVREVIFQTDRQGHWSFLNPAWREISGYDIYDSLERPLTDFVHTTEKKLLTKLFEEIICGKRHTVRREVRFVNRQQQIIWMDMFVKAYLDDNGEVAGMSGALSDITQRKKAEQTVHESRQWLESINKNIKEAILRVDHQQGLVYSNCAFADMFGYGQEGHPVSLSALFAQEADLRVCTKVLAKQTAFTNKIILFRRKDGSTFWGLSSFMLVVDENGHTFYDGAVRDITDRKEAEQKLKEKNQELIKINEELDRFVYSASHDLRAPLASTLGLINISRFAPSSQEQGQYLDLMEQSLNRMDKLIQDLTDYSRNARLEIETEEIDFDTILKDVLQRLKYIKTIDQVKINTRITAEEVFYSDKIRIYVILINLISNALKYHKYDLANPQINIDITINDRQAVIAVADNGIGIEKGYLDKIFTMFFQVTRDSIGSGLGLYIAKETINKLRGTIKVKSVVSKGSTFTVTLPNAKTYSYDQD